VNSLELANYALLHNPWRARMHLAVTTAVASVAIPFDTVDFDPSSMCTTGAGAKITIQQDGYYLVSGSGQNATTATIHRVDIRKNGTTDTYGSVATVSAVGLISNASAIIKCAAGDAIQLYSATTTSITGNVNNLEVAWIAPA
jgi:flagellar basal body rod protein FlgF